MKGLVVAGTHSGVGKTTIACGIAAAFRRRGFTVSPFKAGPDYIDPSHHEAAAGVPSRNLDLMMLPAGALVELFERAASASDLVVVEGVMGLYDGASADPDEGSTARLAKLLGLPVVLVVDAAAAAASVAATVFGFRLFDPELQFAGVILNGIAGEGHLALVKPALERTGLPLLGYLPHREEFKQPERYLGLVPGAEAKLDPKRFDQLAAQMNATVDLDALWNRLGGWKRPEGIPNPQALFPENAQPPKAMIAVARDRAFSFYYADSIDLLQAWGAEIAFFSPIEDDAPPEGASAVYVGGGFPEKFAGELSANETMRSALAAAVRSEMPVYGECGGLMFLGDSLQDQEGVTHRMAGVLPVRTTLRDTRLSIGYRTVTAVGGHPFLPPETPVTGHEFHLSALAASTLNERALYNVPEFGGASEGFVLGSVSASYIHLHLGARPGLAERFVETAARARRKAEY